MGSFNTRARTTLYLGNTRPRPGPLLICQYQELTRFPSAPSDQRRFQGSINKHGNPRLRTVLVEASWRLIQFQPDYKAVAKWRKVLADPKATRSKRKQIAVAIGRQFSVDWWRVRTNRCQAEDLGLKLQPPKAPPASSKTKRALETDRKTQ